jgi:hypothetical protein
LHERTEDSATALLQRLPCLDKSVPELVALGLLTHRTDRSTELGIIALSTEQDAKVDPCRNGLDFFRLASRGLARSKCILNDFDLETFDVDIPLLALALGPLPRKTLGDRVKFENQCQGVETTVEVLDVVVATAKEPVQVIKRANADVELGDEALTSGWEEANAEVTWWREFSRRSDNLEGILRVQDSSGFGEDFFAGEQDVNICAGERQKRIMGPLTVS